MTPHEARAQLSAYLDGELDPASRQAVDAALATDPALRDELAALRRTVEALRSLPRCGAPSGFAARVAEAIATEPPRRAAWRRPRLLAAAACLLVALAALLLLRPAAPPPKASQPPEAPPAHKARTGQADDRARDKARAEKLEGAKAATAGDLHVARTPAAEPDTAHDALAAARTKPGPPGADPLADTEKGRGHRLFREREEELHEAVRHQAPPPATRPSASAENAVTPPGRHVVTREYTDLRQALARVRSALDAAGVPYVIQPVGSGRFTVEAALAPAQAAALLARLGPGEEAAQTAQAPEPQPSREPPSRTVTGRPAGGRGPDDAPPATAQTAAGAATEARVHLLLRFEPRPPAPEAGQPTQP
jgi:hypothetical protein